jgi:DNA polymerase-3 subunit epsilon
MDLEAMAAALDASPDYRVLRRFVPRTRFHGMPSSGLKRGVILDTETTGMDMALDEVIELGMVAFTYDPSTGQAYEVVGTLDLLEQPSKPIPPESTQVHGITDEMVRGKRIDDDQVAVFLRGVDLVIAHNAQFDRGMVEKRLPIFETLSWACSLKEVPWQREGMGSAKLDYLLNQFGFFHEAHRAEADCLALLDVLQRPLPGSGRLGMAWLMDAQRSPTYRVWATGSPFDNKEKLKALGYRFDGTTKVWNLLTTADQVELDLVALKEAGFNGRPARIQIETLDGRVKYSKRSGEKVQRSL